MLQYLFFFTFNTNFMEFIYLSNKGSAKSVAPWVCGVYGGRNARSAIRVAGPALQHRRAQHGVPSPGAAGTPGRWRGSALNHLLPKVTWISKLICNKKKKKKNKIGCFKTFFFLNVEFFFLIPVISYKHLNQFWFKSEAFAPLHFPSFATQYRQVTICTICS